jgi:hypothetical protein
MKLLIHFQLEQRLRMGGVLSNILSTRALLALRTATTLASHKIDQYYGISLIQSASLFSSFSTEALSHTKPASAWNLNRYSPAFRLTLFHGTVLRCRPPASKQASRLLKIFFDAQRSYVLKC